MEFKRLSFEEWKLFHNLKDKMVSCYECEGEGIMSTDYAIHDYDCEDTPTEECIFWEIDEQQCDCELELKSDICDVCNGSGKLNKTYGDYIDQKNKDDVSIKKFNGERTW